MRIISWNLNGIRAAIRKGLASFMERLDGDVWLFQEIRARPDQLSDEWAHPKAHVTWHPAERPGYSGVATWSKAQHDLIRRGMPSFDMGDPEGRLLVTQHGDLTLVNTYLPNGGSSPERQDHKEAWMDAWSEWLHVLLASEDPVIVAGDLNIAHTESDIWNPSGNRTTSGFLPQERDWFTNLIEQGWVDLHRRHVGARQGPYTWWSNRGRARELDRGWRIDYMLGNDRAAQQVEEITVLREGGMVISDHAPLILDLKHP